MRLPRAVEPAWLRDVAFFLEDFPLVDARSVAVARPVEAWLEKYGPRRDVIAIFRQMLSSSRG